MLVWKAGSMDGRLYWNGKNNRLKEKNSLAIADITHVIHGKHTPALEHAKVVSERRCLAVVTPDDILEVELDSQETCEHFYAGLTELVERCAFSAANYGENGI